MLTRDRVALLRQALDSYATHTDAKTANITVLNDRTSRLPVWTPLGGLQVMNTQPIGTGALRNLVIRYSEKYWGRGDFLYLSDNDVFFKPGWLGTLTRLYEFAYAQGFRALGAYNHPFNQPVSTIYSYDAYAINEVNALSTQSMLMRWSVWDEFGPFVDTPVDRVCQSEDVEFSNRIRAAGFKVGVVNSPLIVSTGITNTFGEHIPGWEMVKGQAPEGVLCE